MVASGAEAQRLAGELLPQVVVLDVDLPDESGWLSAAKILLVHPSRRVVLLTAPADDQLRQRARSIGAAGVVARDEGPDALAAMIFGRHLSEAV
jgi:LuxR family maltose regulon positive regulatory protein